MPTNTSRPGSAWILFALFGILVLGTGAALHRERALFAETTGSTDFLTQAAEEFTFSVPFRVEGELNFAPDLPIGRLNIPGRNFGIPGSSLIETPLPTTAPTQSLLGGAPPANLADGRGSGEVILLGSGQSVAGSPFGYTAGPSRGSSGGGSISTATPTPTATPPVGVVREPATWALMIFGFALVGGAMRRRATGRLANRKAIAA